LAPPELAAPPVKPPDAPVPLDMPPLPVGPSDSPSAAEQPKTQLRENIPVKISPANEERIGSARISLIQGNASKIPPS
jgi:hypothetical protein